MRYLRETPLGFCLRVIVNEKPQNIVKAAFSVLSVIVDSSLNDIYFEEKTSAGAVEWAVEI